MSRAQRSFPAPALRRATEPPAIEDWVSDPSALVWRHPSGALHAVSRRRAGVFEVMIPNLGVLSLTEDGDATGSFHREDERLLLDAYHRFALPIFLQARGHEVLHASAVVGPQGVIGFCGESGSGKSTTACALSTRGHQLWADDTLVFERDGDRFAAVALPFRPRLAREAIDRLGPPSQSSERPARSPLAAICLLERRPADSPALERLGARESFRALIDHAYSFDLAVDDRNEAMLQTYFDLAERVPIWRLSYRPSLDELPAMLGLIESTLCAFAPLR